HEDRRWEFGCQATFGQSAECYWTNYVNDFDQALLFECPAEHVMTGTSSYHNDYFEDRRWRFYCCRSPCVTKDCHWTSYVNSFDEYFTWTVPSRNILVGAQSYHQNHEDWRFYCCRSPCVTKDCHWTSYVNSFDEYFTWTVPSRNILVGAQSYHQNHEEDRRWRYKVCVQYRC
uniref:Uncharacterized protein n=1 Tax=Sinocyclocheilus rhinocerous TaxID=307959 RepID=A0A673GB32_9TELE